MKSRSIHPVLLLAGLRFDQATVPLNLSTGYNRIGLPVDPEPATRYTASVVVAEIAADDGEATRVLRHNGTGYGVYTAGGGGTNFTLTTGDGYFFRSAMDSTWNVTQ